MRATYRSILCVVAVLAVTAACKPGGKTPAPPGTPGAATPTAGGPAGGGGRPLLAPEPTPGVYFRLSDAEPGAAEAAAGVRNVPGEALDAATVERLLGRLPALPGSAAVTTTFALRPGPRPPAIPGDTKSQPWPPAATAEAPPVAGTGPLTVVRASPEGDVPMATQLTVTFSEPMVPLSSHGALAQQDVPVKLSPQPEGQWRWVGTRTLLFEPDPRFPMATEYSAEVPAGTKSARGAALAEAHRWTFRTPPARVERFWPTLEAGPVVREPLMIAVFDQRVDPAAVLGATAVTAGNGDGVSLRLATAAELEADETAKAIRDGALADRWVAFRPAAPLPGGARITVTFGPGLPSAEGPRKSEEEQAYRFNVFGPLAVTGIGCARRESPSEVPSLQIDNCDPAGPFGITFNNPLDDGAFDPAAFHIAPEASGVRYQPTTTYEERQHGAVMVVGQWDGRTEYVVTVPAGVKDVFGQTLGKDTQATFVTGDASPQLYVPGNDMLVLDPAAGGKLDLASVNNETLSVDLYRVRPTDWAAFQDYQRRFDQALYSESNQAPPAPPWPAAWSGEVKPGGERDKLTPVRLDLAPALTDGIGHVVVVVQPSGWNPKEDRWQDRPQLRWVQVTKLGLSLAADRDGGLAWVTDLASGRPVAGAQVGELGVMAGPVAAAPATTDAGGLARLGALPQANEAQPLLVAARDGDTTFLPASLWFSREPRRALLWHAFTDRGLYKPGETVRVKGWLRPMDWGKGGDLGAADRAVTRIAYTLTASNGEEVAQGNWDTTPAGGFDGALALPAEIELGQANLRLTAEGGGYPAELRDWSMSIPVAEFRRPEFEVTATSEQPYYFLGDTGTVTARAAYYAGGTLAGAETSWNVTGSPASFSPPGHDGFTFGRFRPWWWGGWGPEAYGQETTKSHSGQTDGGGEHRLAITFDNVVPLAPASFRAEATVQDVNRQAWTGAASFLVHPARHYVGLRPDRWFADPGKPFKVDVLVADLDGKIIAGTPVQIKAERVEGSYKGGEYVEETVPAGGCEVASAAEPVACELTFKDGGEYRLTATIRDPEGRQNVTELKLWVSGGEPVVSQESVGQQRAELIPSADEYQPGDSAEILVRAPFSPAEGLMTLRRSGLVKSERFQLDGGSHTLKLPITEAEMPNVTVQVDLVGSAPRRGPDGRPDTSLPPVPAFASGSLDLKVPPRVRSLTVTARPQSATLAPAGSTTIDVVVTGADGKPVPNAEVALVVADEAVLALTDYHIGDPLATFYPQRGAEVSDAQSRDRVWLADPAALAASVADERAARAPRMGGAEPEAALMMDTYQGGIGLAPASSAATQGLPMDIAVTATALWQLAVPTPRPGSPATGGGEGEPMVAERTNLDPLALFAPTLVTGADGTVSAEVKLPDSVTRYRISAVATDGGQRFGLGEDALTARLPLAARPSAPRFLNFGDRFELPVVLQNQTDQALQTDVVVRAANLKLGDGTTAGKRVTVPANDRVEVRFPASAELPGTAAFQAGAFAGDLADAQRVSLPVWTPATTEAFATYGELDRGAAAQPVQRPPEVVPGFGGLEMTLTSTALGNLTDAYLYLQDYPYEGAEQVASRLLATVALKDVLTAFQVPEIPDQATIDAAVRRDLGKLAALQNGDGGFGWWSRYMDPRGSEPFVTTHVIHALARAKDKGYAPDANVLEQAQQYLRDIDQHLDAWEYPRDSEGRRSIKAYALYTRLRLGDRDAVAARAVFREPGERQVDALGWLLLVLTGDQAATSEVAEIRRQLANRASEEAATAQFTTDYDESAANVVLASDRRADAVALEALIADQPDDPLIPKLARGLLDHRVKGRWGSTQENAWVLLALDRYFRAYEKDVPDFVARAWLGDGYVGESTFEGRSADRSETRVPMDALLPEPTDLVLAKDGPGRLYYRLGLRYAPADLKLEPMERGFAVTRSYEAVDDPGDVKRLADGSYEVKAGARVRVRLNMVADSRRYHVALVDPLPAGLEALNPELAVTGTLPPDEPRTDEPGMPGLPEPEAPVARPRATGDWWWGWGPWYDHQAFRDERTEAFTNLLAPGVYDYTYIARATTPGTFVVPPTKAEELYHPETFGRGGTDRVVVR